MTTPHRLRRTGPALALMALTALTAASLPAHALNYTWAGNDGLWEEAAKWSLLGVPGADDNVIINGTGTGSLRVTQPTHVNALVLGFGTLGGPGTLTAASFDFLGGRLGASTASGGGTLAVTGQTHFSGTAQLTLDYSHTLQLGGDALWYAGNGILGVQPGYSAGNSSYPGSSLRIGAGTVFTDQGAADASGSKQLGYYGGAVVNEGTYSRSGAGSTLARGFDNRGTLEVLSGSFAFTSGGASSTSSGSIRVGAGATLLLGNATLTAGSLQNNGLVVLSGGTASIGENVSIDGAWRLNGHDQRATIAGTHPIQSLTLDDGWLSTGTLVTDTLAFNGGTLGHSNAAAFGELIVTGSASFNGSAIQALDYSKRLRLLGNTTWSAGNGSITVQPGYTAGNQSFVESSILINTTATFTDLGAASAAGSKTLGYYGGSVLNDGTYVRQGAGTTVARHFQNNGTLRIEAGSFAVDGSSSNHGTVQLAAGTVLAATQTSLVNAGLITGQGTVRLFNHATTSGLAHYGTLDPGSAGAAGTLIIDGALTMMDGSALHIDLFGAGSDQLVVVDAVTWNGELALSGELARSDTEALSFVIASYGQRLANSSFDRITWNGQEAMGFTVEYGANSLTLHVSAVPEPAAWALLLAGSSALLVRRRRA